jgi:hypothetical protein
MTSPYWEGTARFVSAMECEALKRKEMTIRIRKINFFKGHINRIMASNPLEIKGDKKEFDQENTNNNALFQPYL